MSARRSSLSKEVLAHDACLYDVSSCIKMLHNTSALGTGGRGLVEGLWGVAGDLDFDISAALLGDVNGANTLK